VGEEECTLSKQQRIAVGRSGSRMSKNNHDEIEAAALVAVAGTRTIAVGLNPTTTTIF
jgi:hypothetical protein